MNRLAPISSFLAFAVALVFSGSARADLVYDSGLAPGPFTSGVTADVANTSSITSTDFTLGATSQINEVKWDGKYYTGNTPPVADAFTIRIYDLSGSTPTSTPLYTYNVGNAVHRTSTGITDNNGQTVYSYDASFATTTLAAGRYAFSVQDSTVVGGNNYFFWTFAYFPGHQVFLGTFLLDNNFNTAFSLYGPSSVPEPASLLMLGTGSLVLGAYARRRKSAAS